MSGRLRRSATSAITPLACSLIYLYCSLAYQGCNIFNPSFWSYRISGNHPEIFDRLVFTQALDNIMRQQAFMHMNRFACATTSTCLSREQYVHFILLYAVQRSNCFRLRLRSVGTINAPVPTLARWEGGKM